MRFLTTGGTWLVAGALTAMPFAVALALPVVDLGIFGQVEPVAVALHVLSAITALGLMLVSVGTPGKLSGTFAPPAVAFAALALAGAVLMPFAQEPYRSLHGGLEHGVGILWFAELALAIVGATYLRREAPRAFGACAFSAAASVALCAALQVTAPAYGGKDLVPYVFPGYLGPDALLAAIPLVAMRALPLRALGLVLAVVGLAVSGNRGAMLAVPAGLAIWWVASRLRPAASRGFLAASGPVVAAGLLAVMMVAAPLIQDWRLSRPLPDAPGLLSEKPIDRLDIQLSSVGTVWQRSVSARLVGESVAEVPGRLLTGRGFGSFQTVTTERSGEVPGRRFAEALPTASRLYWDGDNKARFHSHDLLLEAFLSAGLAGGIAWLAMLWSVGRGASREALPAASLLVATIAVAGSFWFLVNAALPLLAFAVASVLPALRVPGRPSRATVLATPALALAMVAAAGAGAVSYSAAAGERDERYFPPLMAGPGGPPCVGFHADLMPDRQANVALYRLFMNRVRDKADLAIVEIAPRLTNLANWSCLMRSYALAGDVEALDASLTARGFLSATMGYTNPILERVMGPDYNLWIDDIERMLDLAPSRTDVVVPFLNWAAGAGRPDRVKAAARLLPRLGEDDPVRHLLASAVAAVEGKTDVAEAERSKSLALGLANVTQVRTQAPAAGPAASAEPR